MPYKFAMGWKRSIPDPRDWHFIPPRRMLLHLPAYDDESPGMGPQLDQRDIGSCGPNTADECIEFGQKAEGLPVVSASRLFIYWTTRYLMGTTDQDSGVDNRTLMKALNSYGFCPETLWPYDTAKFKQQPPKAAFDAALPNRINNYAAVTQSLSQMQGTIVSGFPFIFGFTVYPQIQSDQAGQNGILTDPGAGDSPIGGHDVTICGYTTVDRPGVMPGNKWPAGTFKFRNHWTLDGQTPWGDGGYGYISFKYATDPNQAGDFWVINAIPGGTPTPPPPPPSPPPSPPVPPPSPPVPPPAPPTPPPPHPVASWFAALDPHLRVLFKIPIGTNQLPSGFLGIAYFAILDQNLRVMYKWAV